MYSRQVSARRSTITLTLITLFGLMMRRELPVAATTTCTPNLSCLNGNANDACVTVQTKPQMAAVCGQCKDEGDGCGLQCKADADQSSCTGAEPVTCTKTATGTGGIGISASCGTTSVIDGDALVEPEVLTSRNGALDVALTVEAATLNATAFRFQSRLFCYNGKCSTPAPTLRVRPGDTLTVTVTNNLPAENAHTSEWHHNTLRHPNTVNLHTHGLHVDPRVDNVLESISPNGGSKTYAYEIPVDHLPGMHWYHPHHHGASLLHLLEGMVGALEIFDDSKGDSYPTASYAAMASTTLVFTHHALCTCNPTDDPFAVRAIPHLQILMGDDLPLNYAQTSGDTETDVFLTNGQYQPKKTLQQGEWHRFEMILAVPDTFLEIEIRDAVGSSGNAQCEMKLLAMDGVWLRNGPRDISVFLFTIAGRASIAVRCNTTGTFYLQSNPEERAADFEASFLQNLLTLEVMASSTTTMTPPTWTSSDISWPFYMTDLQSTSVDYTVEYSVEQTGVSTAAPAGAWLGVGTDCALSCTGRATTCDLSDPNTVGTCAYIAMPEPSGTYRFSAPVCSTVDWVLQGRGATAHPMHLHAHHFQIISFVDSNGKTDGLDAWGQNGDWRDTMPAIAGTTRLRFKVDSFTGAMMIHCHYLLHEDLGMMDRWWAGDENTQGCIATSTTSNCNSSVPTEAFQSVWTKGTVVNCNSGTTTSTTTSATTNDLATVTTTATDGGGVPTSSGETTTTSSAEGIATTPNLASSSPTQESSEGRSGSGTDDLFGQLSSGSGASSSRATFVQHYFTFLSCVVITAALLEIPF